MHVGLVQHPDFLRHDNGPGHPERGERLVAVSAAIERQRFAPDLVDLPTRIASNAELELVHDSAYLDRLEKTRARDLTILDPDTRATRLSYDIALLAAGSAVSATQESLRGDVRRSFVLARPPGHHAEADRAMGFCLLNNAAIAAATAVAHYGMDRVAIVDWDVHHGNGTASVFESRADVLYISMHQYPHYPGTGAVHENGIGAGSGYTINIPLSVGSTDADYGMALKAIVLPILREYAPQLIIVSAGFDAHHKDPLGGMLLTAEGFASLTWHLVNAAEECAEGRIVHLLEGGYDLDGLAEGVCAVLSILTGMRAELTRGEDEAHQPRPVAIKALRTVRERHSGIWPIAEVKLNQNPRF